MKGYIALWKLLDGDKLDYRFSVLPANAAVWATRKEAEENCDVFNRHRIVINTASGPHVCADFKVEERAPDEFVAFCEAPFSKINDE